MANVNKAKHAFGQSTNIEAAKQAGKINEYDILFLDGDSDPKIGWIDAQGNTVIVPNKTDLSGVEAELATKANVEDVETLESQITGKADAAEVEELESQIAEKVSADEVDSKIKAALGEIECAPETYEKVKYEIANAPDGTLIKMNDNEIRICCPADAEYSLQNVGTGGDANTYYVTFKTYVYDGNVVGYKEHLGNSVDAEILTDLKTDEYGRRYQPTWLGIAKYDESTGSWSYYGANSSEGKYIGWDYQLDLFDANGVMVASDSIRINLSNEGCHYAIEPYYVGGMMAEVDKKIAEATVGAIEVVEF